MILDAHVHVWPDTLVQKNLEMISKLSGLTPAYDGSLSSLSRCMEKCQIGKSFINNIVLKPELLKKANDWTANAVSTHKEKLIGMGFLIAGAKESVDEAQRCVSELGFKGFKMHHSHMKLMPDDQENYTIYERISELKVPVLFHCGRNPYSKDGLQFSLPRNFEPVLSSFSKMRVILGHLAGFEDDPEDARRVIANHPNVVADTAIDFAKTNGESISEFIHSVGIRKFVFGSDFPIHDPLIAKEQLASILSKEEFSMITRENPLQLFEL